MEGLRRKWRVEWARLCIDNSLFTLYICDPGIINHGILGRFIRAGEVECLCCSASTGCPLARSLRTIPTVCILDSTDVLLMLESMCVVS